MKTQFINIPNENGVLITYNVDNIPKHILAKLENDSKPEKREDFEFIPKKSKKK